MSIERKCVDICDSIVDCSACEDELCEEVCEELTNKCYSLCIDLAQE